MDRLDRLHHPAVRTSTPPAAGGPSWTSRPPAPCAPRRSTPARSPTPRGTAPRPDVPAEPGTGPDTPRPALLTGYGGFSVPRTWLHPDRAGSGRRRRVRAPPSLRGGGEEGEQWHRAGMRENKQNTFDDFTPPPNTWINTGWTTLRPAGHLRRLQRWSAGGRGADPAARPLPGGGVPAPLRWTWCATRSSCSAAPERGVRHRRRPRRARVAVVHSPYHHVEEGTPTCRCCSPSSNRTRGRPQPRPQDALRCSTPPAPTRRSGPC